MEQLDSSKFEAQVRKLAGQMRYPPTPDIASIIAAQLMNETNRGRKRYLRIAIQASFAVIVLFLAAMLVPGVRAAVLEFLQIGSVRIQLATRTPSPAASTPNPFPTPYPSLFSSVDLGGETTLQAAQEQVDFTILLPNYPSDLGKPDRVFLQDQNGDLLVLIWMDPLDNNRASLSLIEMEPTAFISKGSPETITETTVNDAPAVWLQGEHYLFLTSARSGLGINVTILGNVLIWEKDGITFRLESSLELEESTLIAESLAQIP